jgi:hypothetical protein
MVLRWIRRAVLFWILFVVVLLVAADYGVRVVSQYVVAHELQTAMALQERPKVSLGGWPFLTELVTGDIDSVTVSAKGSVTTDQVSVQGLDLDLRDVRFSLGDLFAGGGQKITADSGEGTVTMTEDDINAALPDDLGVTVDLKNGKVLLKSDQVKGNVQATVRVSQGQLLLESDELPAIELDLPELAKGLTFTKVSIDGDAATFTLDLQDATFET